MRTKAIVGTVAVLAVNLIISGSADAGQRPKKAKVARVLTRPANARVGCKRVSLGTGLSAFLGGPRRTGVTYYGGGNYAVNYSDGSVGSMQGTRPSSTAPAQPVQTDTNNAGSTGSGGFDTPGHVVNAGN
jgi:hypothetical protein